MKTEKEIVTLVRDCYTSATFEPMFPLMTEDYVHMSFWVIEVLRGKEAAQNYYRGKGEAIREGGNLPTGRVVRILSAPDRLRPRGLWRGGRQMVEAPECCHREDAGKLAVLMQQWSNGELVETLMIPTVTPQGMLRQICVTDPAFFVYEEADRETEDTYATQAFPKELTGTPEAELDSGFRAVGTGKDKPLT